MNIRGCICIYLNVCLCVCMALNMGILSNPKQRSNALNVSFLYILIDTFYLYAQICIFSIILIDWLIQI